MTKEESSHRRWAIRETRTRRHNRSARRDSHSTPRASRSRTMRSTKRQAVEILKK